MLFSEFIGCTVDGQIPVAIKVVIINRPDESKDHSAQEKYLVTKEQLEITKVRSCNIHVTIL